MSLPLHLGSTWIDEAIDEYEAYLARKQAEVEACGCRACDPGEWADDEQYERSQDV